MIFSTKKSCSVDGCTYPLFGRGYCHSHYKTLFLYPKMNQLDKKRQEKGIKTKKKPKIKKNNQLSGRGFVKVSLETSQGRYRRKRIQFIKKKRAEDPGDRLFCIFCGKVIKGEPSLHHYNGRDGSLLLDDTKWVLSHNRCHVFEYHSLGWEKCKWWSGYLERIRYDYPDLYEKELNKMNK